MSQGDFQAANPYASFGAAIADAPADARAAFIRKTYTHLLIAVYGCAALCWVVFQTELVQPYAQFLSSSPYMWLGVLVVFSILNRVADSWARSETSIGLQYAGMCISMGAWAAIMCPLLYVAQFYSIELTGDSKVDVISAAGVITLVMFGGLTAVAWISRADFSFMRTGLALAGLGAMGLIVCSILFGFNLGVWFTGGMVILASGYVLYDTSNIIHHYREGQHVAASVALFASVALLFWYVVQILMAFSSRD